MTTYIGSATSRVDGRAKVTGQAKYAGEFNAPNLAYGFVVDSPIAKGRIASIDATKAEGLPGVIKVLTHENRPAMARGAQAWKDMTPPQRKVPPFRPTLRRNNHVQPAANRVSFGRRLGDRALRRVACGNQIRNGAEPHRLDGGARCRVRRKKAGKAARQRREGA